MKQGIIIVTSFKTESFLLDLLDSLLAYKQYPTYIHKNTAENNQYEMGGIKLGLKLEDSYGERATIRRTGLV